MQTRAEAVLHGQAMESPWIRCFEQSDDASHHLQSRNRRRDMQGNIHSVGIPFEVADVPLDDGQLERAGNAEDPTEARSAAAVKPHFVLRRKDNSSSEGEREH